MFGVANQLLAALALAIGTTILIKMGKVRYAPITAVPMAFMFVVTFTAAVQLMQRFWAEAALKPENALVLKIDALLVGFMALSGHCDCCGCVLHMVHYLISPHQPRRCSSRCG